MSEAIGSSLVEKAQVINGTLILPKVEDVDTLSPTKIRALNDCEVKYFYRYIKGLKIPPAAVLTFGSSFDDAVSTNMLQKIATGMDLPVEDVVDAFVTSFNIRKDETEFTEAENFDNMKDNGVRLIRAYQKTTSWLIQPKYVQKKYEIQFTGVAWKLIGYADIVEKDPIIRDTKTSKRSPPRKNGEYIIPTDYWFQLLCYYIAERKLNPGLNEPLRLVADFAVKSKNPKIISVEVPEPTKGDLKYFQQITSRSYAKMELIKRDLLPVIPNRNSRNCTKKYCAYWSKCVQDYGGSVKD